MAKRTKRSATLRGAICGIALAFAGCSNSGDVQSLREGLADLPQDTFSDRVAPADTASVAIEGPAGLPDTAGLPFAVLPPDSELAFTFADSDSTVSDSADAFPGGDDQFDSLDSGRPNPRPRDTEPWIPRSRTQLFPEAWTDGVREEVQRGRPAVLTDVRAARNDDFDRVVFEFDNRLPGYRVEYVDGDVRQCGSGQPVDLEGDAWLRVRFVPAQAHDDRGQVTVRNRSFRTDLPMVRQVRLICDYEGEVGWIVDVDRETRFRVLTLDNPARLVLDVEH